MAKVIFGATIDDNHRIVTLYDSMKERYPNETNFKVVLVDNFDREIVADKMLTTDVKGNSIPASIGLKDACRIVEEYNNSYPDDWDWYAKVVPVDYKLWGGMEELV